MPLYSGCWKMRDFFIRNDYRLADFFGKSSKAGTKDDASHRRVLCNPFPDKSAASDTFLNIFEDELIQSYFIVIMKLDPDWNIIDRQYFQVT